MSAPLSSAVPLLEARAIERRYQRQRVWSDLSFTVHPGELLLVAGANGAGKSTLLRTLAGLARPTRGSVWIAGGDVYGDVRARDTVGYLGHATGLYRDLTARENLRFAATMRGLAPGDQEITAALSEVGLAERADQRVGRFSRGMAQRLALARVGLHRPRLLLLDEPFTGLDGDGVERLRQRLAAARRAGTGVLCVTHDPAEVWELATRVLLLGERRLLADVPRPDRMVPLGELVLPGAA